MPKAQTAKSRHIFDKELGLTFGECEESRRGKKPRTKARRGKRKRRTRSK